MYADEYGLWTVCLDIGKYLYFKMMNFQIAIIVLQHGKVHFLNVFNIGCCHNFLKTAKVLIMMFSSTYTALLFTIYRNYWYNPSKSVTMKLQSAIRPPLLTLSNFVKLLCSNFVEQ